MVRTIFEGISVTVETIYSLESGKPGDQFYQHASTASRERDRL